MIHDFKHRRHHIQHNRWLRIHNSKIRIDGPRPLCHSTLKRVELTTTQSNWRCQRRHKAVRSIKVIIGQRHWGWSHRSRIWAKTSRSALGKDIEGQRLNDGQWAEKKTMTDGRGLFLFQHGFDAMIRTKRHWSFIYISHTIHDYIFIKKKLSMVM